MPNNNETQESYVHYPRISLRTKVADNKPLFLLGSLIAIITCFAVLAGGLITPLTLHTFGFAAMMIFNFAFGFGFCAGGMALIKAINRKTFGKYKTELLALEDKVVANAVPLTLDETHKLIEHALKANHQRLADFYSKQVMAISMTGSELRPHNAAWMISTDCWTSTDDFNNRWLNKLWSPYQTRGVFSLGSDYVGLQTKKFSFECSPSQIRNVEIRQHSKWVKPLPAKYIYLTISDDGVEHSFVVTPSLAITDTIWEANKLVDQWVQHIQKVRQSNSNRSI